MPHRRPWRHVEQCDHCGHRRVWYNSCRNRHCPTCQSLARAAWIDRRRADLLPTEYFHVVFTVPPAVAEIAARNKAVVYGLLFRAVAETLRTIAADPRHLGAEIGFFAVLHTWGQTLVHHPHLHCVIPGGGLASDGSGWVSCRPGFFLPVRVLSRYFRRVLLQALQDAFESGQLRFAGRLQPLSDPGRFAEHLRPAREAEWVVYAKPPFAGPEQVLDYLGRYTHRIAIGNQRLCSLDDGSVRFRYTDYRRAGASRQKTMTLTATEFIRRMLLHVLPPGFHRIRYYGFLANRNRRAEAHRVPAPAARAPATLGRARRLRHNRLSRALRGADRSLVAAVSPVRRRAHARRRLPRRPVGVSGPPGFVVTRPTDARQAPSAVPGVPGPVDLRLRRSSTVAGRPSWPSSPTGVGRQPPRTTPSPASQQYLPTIQRP